MLGLKRTDGNLMFLYAVYLAALSVGNVLDDSWIILFGMTLPASVLAYPITLLVLCIICELWTASDAARLALLGMGMKFVGIVLLGLAQLFTLFPEYSTQRGLWNLLGLSFWEVSGQMVLGTSVRFWTASLISFPCAQMMGVTVFSAMRNRHVRRTGGPWGGRWLRYLGGSLAGETVEVILFLTMIMLPDWNATATDVARQMYARGVMTVAWLPVFYALTWRRRKNRCLTYPKSTYGR